MLRRSADPPRRNVQRGISSRTTWPNTSAAPGAPDRRMADSRGTDGLTMPTGTSATDWIDQLPAELRRLRAAGAIDKEEFERRRRQVMAGRDQTASPRAQPATVGNAGRRSTLSGPAERGVGNREPVAHSDWSLPRFIYRERRDRRAQNARA